jgi:hypothetical protein
MEPGQRLARISQNCEDLKGHFKDEIFYDCTFKDLQGLTLDNCVLNKCRFLTDTIEEARGFTLTLNCNSFRNVEYSPLLFDLFLCMALKSAGNVDKRQKLLEVIGKDRAIEILTALKDLD